MCQGPTSRLPDSGVGKIVGQGLIVDVKPKYSVVQIPDGGLTANGQYIVRWGAEPDVEEVHINDTDKVKNAKNNTQLLLQ